MSAVRRLRPGSYIAIQDYVAEYPDDELSFVAGQTITVENKHESGWWRSTVGDMVGWLSDSCIECLNVQSTSPSNSRSPATPMHARQKVSNIHMVAEEDDNGHFYEPTTHMATDAPMKQSENRESSGPPPEPAPKPPHLQLPALASRERPHVLQNRSATLPNFSQNTNYTAGQQQRKFSSQSMTMEQATNEHRLPPKSAHLTPASKDAFHRLSTPPSEILSRHGRMTEMSQVVPLPEFASAAAKTRKSKSFSESANASNIYPSWYVGKMNRAKAERLLKTDARGKFTHILLSIKDSKKIECGGYEFATFDELAATYKNDPIHRDAEGTPYFLAKPLAKNQGLKKFF